MSFLANYIIGLFFVIFLLTFESFRFLDIIGGEFFGSFEINAKIGKIGEETETKILI